MTSGSRGKRSGRGGPRTLLGKSRSRGNARKHGIFSTELTMSATEKAEFNALRASLGSTRTHDGPIRDLLFDNLVTVAWQLKIALRAWQTATNAADQDATAESEPDSGPGPPLSYPYPLNRTELRHRLKLLQEVGAEFESSGYLPKDRKEELARAFGADFPQILTDWEPELKLMFSMRMAGAMFLRSKAYDMPPPVTPLPEAAGEFSAADALLRRSMVLKLIDREAEHARLALLHAEAGSPIGSATGGDVRPDLAQRYLTTARREFYRALHEYLKGGQPDSDPD